MIHECFNLFNSLNPNQRGGNTTLYICTFIHVRVIHVTIVNLIQLFKSGCACIFNMGCYWSKTVYKQYTCVVQPHSFISHSALAVEFTRVHYIVHAVHCHIRKLSWQDTSPCMNGKYWKEARYPSFQQGTPILTYPTFIFFLQNNLLRSVVLGETHLTCAVTFQHIESIWT